MKQSQLPPYFKYVSNYWLFYCNQYPFRRYAFVHHRTAWKAEYNRKRPINHLIFGSNCYVEYANSHSHVFSKPQIAKIWNVTVRQIPKNITEECLHNLFIRCHSMKYISARIINNMKTTVISITKSRLLWGWVLCFITSVNFLFVFSWIFESPIFENFAFILIYDKI